MGQTVCSLLKVTQVLRVKPEIGPKSVYFQSLDFPRVSQSDLGDMFLFLCFSCGILIGSASNFLSSDFFPFLQDLANGPFPNMPPPDFDFVFSF